MSVFNDTSAAKTKVDQALEAISSGDLTALETAMRSKTTTTDEMTTVLAHAARKGCPDMIRALSRLGAKITPRNRKLALALVTAAHNEDWDVVECLADLGVALNFRNHHGDCALSLASSKGPMKVIECLVESGANVNPPPVKPGQSPLTAAVLERREDVVKYLLNWGANPSGVSNHRKEQLCPLQAACKTGDVNIVRCLIEAGASVENTKLVPCAAQKGHLEVVRLLVEAGANLVRTIASKKKYRYRYVGRTCYRRRKTVGEKALMNASKKGHEDIVDYLLTSYIGPLTYVLSKAIQRDKQDLVRRIYESNPDRQPLLQCYDDRYQRVQPLVCAVQFGTLETVQYLTEAGANVNEAGVGCRQLLTLALVHNRDLCMIQHLIACGADLNPGYDSERPLHAAVPRGANMEIVQCLLNSGADPMYKNSRGESALEVNMWMKGARSEVVECLLQAGCPYEKCLSSAIRLGIKNEVLNLVKAGASPIVPLPNNVSKDLLSAIRLALLYGTNAITELFLNMLFFDYSDFLSIKKDKDFLKLLSTQSAHSSLALIKEACSQPWKLSCLSFLTISCCVGYGLARHKRVQLTGLPPLFQRQLVFETVPDSSETWQETLLGVRPGPH